MIGPAPILAAIVALFHVSAYVFIRGRAGARLPLLLVAAWLGAWAGDTVGARMAIDPLRVGEFHLLFASFVAWLAIGLVAIVAILVPDRTSKRIPATITTTVRRAPKEESMPAPSTEPEPQAR
jgi:drug/metabolite transporter (DMT)-like permease